MVPLLKNKDRLDFRNFISDPIFSSAINLSDQTMLPFGLQDQIKALAYAGIETKDIRDFVAAIAKNHHKKNINLRNVKKAVAKNVGSRTQFMKSSMLT